MVLCATCGDAVTSGDDCATCGEPDPTAAGTDAGVVLDEALLDRVGDALAAQAALACHTAEDRIAHTADLHVQALVLRGRLRTQQGLLVSALGARSSEVPPRLADALKRVDRALRGAPVYERADWGWQVRVRLGHNVSSAAIARRLLRDYVSEQPETEAGEDLILVASELVTNAYVHGTGAISLDVERLADRLRIDVADEGVPERIAIRVHGVVGSTGGRGLAIVDQLALRWGTIPHSSHVWAELPLA
jgi:anti-sigma regulatory factor (Ser/Thr protein kinase)